MSQGENTTTSGGGEQKVTNAVIALKLDTLSTELHNFMGRMESERKTDSDDRKALDGRLRDAEQQLAVVKFIAYSWNAMNTIGAIIAAILAALLK